MTSAAFSLSPDHVDLEAVDAFLRAQEDDGARMTLARLDGLLTAVAIGPELLMPSDWLPLIWGEDGPTVDDEAQFRSVLGSVMARYNEILRQVQTLRFEPVLGLEHEDAHRGLQDWIRGFLGVIATDPRPWRPLVRDEEEGYLLFPLIGLFEDRSGETIAEALGGMSKDELDELRGTAMARLPECIEGIAAFWRGRRLKPATTAADKVGRNDPCPCGSGLKYKKCCAKAA